MRTENPILITGATGFLGSHFLLWLSQHRPSTAYAVIRGSSNGERQTKLQQALHGAADGYLPSPDWRKVLADTRVVRGDIEERLCGVQAADLEALRDAGAREFWHFAASLNFEEKRRELIRSQNVDGPLNAIDLAIQLGVDRFVYVSTAYTAGAADGHFEEALHSRESSFSNAYEESKCEAEHRVTSRCAEHGLPLTILRPSIVIGSSFTHKPAGTSSGLYGFIRELHRLRRRFERADGPIRMHARPDVRLNFIPVDAVMRDLMRVIDAGFEAGPILHVSVEGGVSVEQLVTRSSWELGIENLVITPEPLEAPSPLEQIVDRRMAFYGSYLRSEKHFSRSLPDTWSIGCTDFERYVAEGVAELRGLALRRAARRKQRAAESA